MRRAIRAFPGDLRAFLTRSVIAPFEFAIGLVSIWTGAISFFGITLGAQTLSQTLPPAMVAAFNLVYFASGIFIVSGLGWGYRNVEAAGLILLISALVIRAIGVSVVAGINPLTITVLFQAVVFTTSCCVRLVTILKRKVLAFVTEIEELPE